MTCESPKSLWTVKKLLSIPTVDVNIADRFGRTPFSICLKNNNQEALNCLLTRTDLKLREEDKKLLTEKISIYEKRYINSSSSMVD